MPASASTTRARPRPGRSRPPRSSSATHGTAGRRYVTGWSATSHHSAPRSTPSQPAVAAGSPTSDIVLRTGWSAQANRCLFSILGSRATAAEPKESRAASPPELPRQMRFRSSGSAAPKASRTWTLRTSRMQCEAPFPAHDIRSRHCEWTFSAGKTEGSPVPHMPTPDAIARCPQRRRHRVAPGLSGECV